VKSKEEIGDREKGRGMKTESWEKIIEIAAGLRVRWRRGSSEF
jgi:hypothetical protein